MVEDGKQSAQRGTAARDEMVIPVIQEQLEIQKRVADTGRGVRIHKTVSELEETIEVPVMKETLEVKTVPIGRMLDGDILPQARTEGNVYIVPVLEEVIVIQKRLRLKEEIHVVRHPQEEMTPQTVTRKIEQAAVERFDENLESSTDDALSNRLSKSTLDSDRGIDQPKKQEMIMANTLVAVYDSYLEAERAYDELIVEGFSTSDVNLSSRDETDQAAQTTSGTSGTDENLSMGQRIRHFFSHMFGGEEDYRDQLDMYSEAVRRGHTILSVEVDDDQESQTALNVLNRHNPVDIDRRAENWRSGGWTGYDESAPAYSDSEIEQERRQYATGGADEKAAIPVVEEELQVGKRTVQGGGVRVYQRVTERPVEEDVQLREERVDVQRRPVNKPATEADMAGVREGSFEVRETVEEPVVGKSARVVEEVVVGKETGERTETVRDTVRRTDVEVEQLGASNAAMPEDTEFRRHWQSTYGTSGGRYEDYDAAYRYGYTMAGNDRYRNYEWSQAEPELRSDWEANHPGTKWERVKDAVRYGAERLTGNRPARR